MLSHMHRTLSIALAATCFALASCGSTDPGLTASRSIVAAPGSTDVITVPTAPTPSSVEINPNDVQISFGPNRSPKPYDDYFKNAVADIQDFWRETYPKVYGEPYKELEGGIYALYSDRSDTIDVCDTTLTYDKVKENARYFGCGDFIAWDDEKLIPDLTTQLGNSAVATVFAHEYGHAIQMRAKILEKDLPTVVTEQQADCFAGAWSAHVARGESRLITFTDAEVKAGLVAMVYVRDPLDPIAGEPVFQQGGHGTAFDRVGAFQHGFINGAEGCKGLIDKPLQLINLTFTTADDAANQGNLAYADIQKFVVDDLSRFWTSTFTANKLTFAVPTISSYPHDGPYPTCDGKTANEWKFHAIYCPSTNTIAYDEGFSRSLYTKYGDFSVGYVLSNAWSEAVQTQLKSNLKDKARVLLNDCLTGVWTKDIIPTGSTAQQFTISPGDLDEAVSTALILDDASQSGALVSAFDKIDNFRAGVLGGLPECNKRITGG